MTKQRNEAIRKHKELMAINLIRWEMMYDLDYKKKYGQINRLYNSKMI